MRKQTFRRGTAAYNLAKAQGRLPSQIAAKKKAVQGPKTKAMSTPTAKQAGNKLIQAGQAASKPKKALSPVMASRQRALEARRKRAAEKAKEKKSAQARQTAAKSKEPKRRLNESITGFRQRLAKYRRENK
mgnify:CR=1